VQATCFGPVEHPQALKYTTLKPKNKIYVHFILRGLKLCILIHEDVAYTDESNTNWLWLTAVCMSLLIFKYSRSSA